MGNSLQEHERLERQIRFFGDEGQDRLSNSTVAIVGCGGLGSHVAQQLAYLGVGDFAVIDPDRADESSGNRMIGFEPDDVGDLKVEIARRTIHRVRPDAEVRGVPEALAHEDAIDAIAAQGVVFGCLDRVVARSDLNQICTALALPLVDLATEINADGQGVWGGRVVFARHGERCLACVGELNQQEVRRELQSAEERADEALLYGVPVDALSDSGPSVVSLNGIIASLGVNEWAVDTAGVRQARDFLVYDGSAGVLRADLTPPMKDCRICKSLFGYRDLAALNLYTRRQ